MNLCTNAAHAMDAKGGVLEVSLLDAGLDEKTMRKHVGLENKDYLQITVSDTGTGIPEENLDKIFNLYFTTKDVDNGTGLGLSVVQSIIQSFGGKIFVDSEIGKGTVFTIYLPIAKKATVSKPHQTDVLPTGSERILLVDDEFSIAKMSSQILEILGYSVIFRTSSIEALELFRAKPNDFDLVITDMTMPNMTGDRLSAELIKIRPKIPVILNTGYSNKISNQQASEIGIKEFVYKPVVKSDLAKIVRKVLDEAKGSAQ